MGQLSKVADGAYAAPTPALASMLDVIRSGSFVTRSDITGDMVAEARRVAACGTTPARPTVIAAWLKALAGLVVNGPDEREAGQQARAMVEVCGDLPATVWNPQTRVAWCRQGEKGKFWPAPAELYAHLKPYADRVTRDVMAAHALLRLAERKAPERVSMSEEERAAMRERLRELAGSVTVEADDVGKQAAPIPSPSQRLAEYRQQLRANPEQADWLAPVIAHLEGEVARMQSESEQRARRAVLNGFLGN